MSENLSSVGKVINTVVKIATTGGILWTQFGCTSTVSAPSAEKTPETTRDYSVTIKDGMSGSFDQNVDKYLANFPGYKKEGSFTLTVDDGDSSTKPITEEFAVVGTANQVGVVANGGNEMRPLDYNIDDPETFAMEDRKTGLTVFTASMEDVTDGGGVTLYYNPLALEPVTSLPGYDGSPIPIQTDTNNGIGGALFRPIVSPALQPSATLEPTATVAPTETPALDPETWNQYGSILVKNGDIAPYGKQLTVNSELGGKFGETVFTLCNHVSYLAALANEFSKSGVDAPPAPTGDLKDFNTYIANVIQPAIDSGKTVEGSHLVAHDKYANKQPGMGMVEPIPNFNPAKCVIKIDGSQQIYPNSLMIDAGSYQIGMDTITLPDGNVVRRLLVNVALTRPKYQVFSANNNTSVDENATAFSQMLNVASENITKIVNEIPLNKSVRDSFVMGPTGGNKSAFSYATTQQAGIDFILEHMADAPMYFVPQTP